MIEPKRGEVWRADLEPMRGDEINKTRPVVVISDDDIGALNLRVVVPVTNWNRRYERYQWMARLEPNAMNGLTKTSAADTFQIRSLSVSRFKERIGTLLEETVEEIAETVALTIGYNPA